MPRQRGRRLWLRVAAHGGTVPVYVQRGPILDDDGVTHLEGYLDNEVPEIVIEASDNVAIMRQRLHHELLHLCFAAHGADVKTHVFGTSSAEGRAKREEDLVCFLEPVQFDLLVRNGFLRYPKPPKV